MDNGTASSDVLRMVGVMAICVGIAWALQIIGFGDVTAFNRLVWLVGAASIAGAGSGAIFAASAMRRDEVPVRI